MKKYPKHIRAQLRRLMDMAYEKELSHELSQLAGHFDSWKAEEISAGELNHLIHRYHDDRAREVYKYYNDEIWSHIEAMVQFLLHEETVKGNEETPKR